MFSNDPMRGSHFIAQTSKFLLIDATAVTLGQCHVKVTQDISPDPYIRGAAEAISYLARMIHGTPGPSRQTWINFDNSM